MVELHPSTHLQAAAWVPDDDPTRPWEDAADLAAGWIWGRSTVEEVAPLLVTNTFGNGVAIGCLDEIARGGGQATPQRKRRFDCGPVLAYVPDARTLNSLSISRAATLSRS